MIPRKQNIDIIRFRITGSLEDRPEVTVPHYFIKEIPSSALRNVVDLGAFNGDTLQRFLALRGDDFDGYHAFEPIPSQHDQLFRTAVTNPRIPVYPFALADFNGTGKFAGPTGGTRFTANGEELPVRRLDDVLQDVRIGFIKMDIEGAEPLALRGAEQTIRGQHPVLAISISWNICGPSRAGSANWI